jgi:hypothetical protein
MKEDFIAQEMWNADNGFICSAWVSALRAAKCIQLESGYLSEVYFYIMCMPRHISASIPFHFTAFRPI